MSAARPQNTLLSLTLDHQSMQAVLVHRTNGNVQLRKSVRAPLALNPFTADPQLVGREIRNHLDQAGIRERDCIVGLPLHAAFTVHVKLPGLPEEDLESFLLLEAERGFPYSPDPLAIQTSRCLSPEPIATLAAIPRQHLEHLQRALQAAQLRPVSFALAATAWQNVDDPSGAPCAFLCLSDTHAEFLISRGSSLAALRSLDLHPDPEGRATDLGWLIRELRVTLGHVPPALVEGLSRLEIFTQTEVAEALAAELAPRVSSLGLQLKPAALPGHLQKVLAPDVERSPALLLGASYLTGHPPALEFLPPKVSRWQQLAARVQSRRLAWVGAAAALLILLFGGGFALQQWKLSRLEKKWSGIEPTTRELDTLQGQIKRFRPWFDHPFRSLIILRGITRSFPAEGHVTAKTLEIRGLSAVTLSGAARDNQAFLETLDQLRAVPEVTDLKVDVLKGKTPLQFTFNFNWRDHRDR